MAFAIGGMRPTVSGGDTSGGRGSPLSPSLGPDARTESFKRGGKVKKTGLAKVDKGERVLTKKQQHERGEKKLSKR